MVPLKYLSNFWRTLEIPLINCEIDLIPIWSTNCFLAVGTVANRILTFGITHSKLYVKVITLSSQDNAKVLEQSKYDFKRTINWTDTDTKTNIQVI